VLVLRAREQIQVGAQAERVPQLRQLHIGLAQALCALRAAPQSGGDQRLLEIERAALDALGQRKAIQLSLKFIGSFLLRYAERQFLR